MTVDPVVKSGRREALFTLALWLAAGTYTVSYCSLHGYQRAPEDIHFVLWFPDWMFWGVVVPWLTCTAISCTFAIFFMQDAPLASAADVTSDGTAPDSTALLDRTQASGSPPAGGGP